MEHSEEGIQPLTKKQQKILSRRDLLEWGKVVDHVDTDEDDWTGHTPSNRARNLSILSDNDEELIQTLEDIQDDDDMSRELVELGDDKLETKVMTKQMLLLGWLSSLETKKSGGTLASNETEERKPSKRQIKITDWFSKSVGGTINP